jgi:acetyltransferase-like isoleucine patch superfamily enzyme
MKHVHVGHDAWIGDEVEMAPGTVIGGHVKVGHRVRMGIGVMVRPGVTIGEGARLGCGAVVVTDVPPGEVWVGNPARCLRTADQHTQDQQDPALAEQHSTMTGPSRA